MTYQTGQWTREVSGRKQYADWWKCKFVFVYGTLKLGHGNNLGTFGGANDGGTQYMQITRTTERGRTVKEFGLWGANAGFPFMTTDSPEIVRVRGEVYEIPFGVFKACDNLEGYPFMYDRSIIQVQLDTGDIVDAWAYHQDHDAVYIGEGSTFVESGNW